MKNECQVLIVDDNSLARKIGARLFSLARPQLVVETAASGEEALQRCRSGPEFQLVVIDLIMPHMDGFELSRRLKAQDVSAKLAISTANVQVATLERVRSLGLYPLGKPLTTERVKTALDTLVPI